MSHLETLVDRHEFIGSQETWRKIWKYIGKRVLLNSIFCGFGLSNLNLCFVYSNRTLERYVKTTNVEQRGSFTTCGDSVWQDLHPYFRANSLVLYWTRQKCCFQATKAGTFQKACAPTSVHACVCFCALAPRLLLSLTPDREERGQGLCFLPGSIVIDGHTALLVYQAKGGGGGG